MAFAKRILLFVGVNILVVTVVTALMAVFHVQPYLTRYGLNLGALAAMCLIYGFVCSLVSLGLSRAIAKWVYGVKLIDVKNCSERERWLVQVVQQLARKANLETMPEVGMYRSEEANAFATGPSKSRSLIAVSSGLLDLMSDDEIMGVLGHEMSHIVNGDMVTMALLQGVINAFVMFISRVVAYAISRDRENNSRLIYWLTVNVLQWVLLLLAAIPMAYYSRRRETCADEGSVDLVGKEKMIAALEALQRTYEKVDTKAQPAMAMAKISSQPQGIWKLWASHPPLAERIAHLRGEDGKQ